jgi:hypothetical protein
MRLEMGQPQITNDQNKYLNRYFTKERHFPIIKKYVMFCLAIIVC